MLWQNGNKSWFPARIGSKVVEAYVNKKRRLAGNLPPEKATAPVEVGAMWTTPDAKPTANGGIGARIHSGKVNAEISVVIMILKVYEWETI